MHTYNNTDVFLETLIIQRLPLLLIYPYVLFTVIVPRLEVLKLNKAKIKFRIVCSTPVLWNCTQTESEFKSIKYVLTDFN